MKMNEKQYISQIALIYSSFYLFICVMMIILILLINAERNTGLVSKKGRQIGQQYHSMKLEQSQRFQKVTTLTDQPVIPLSETKSEQRVPLSCVLITVFYRTARAQLMEAGHI